MSKEWVARWLYVAFIALGVSGTLLGPAFQSLTRKFEIPLETGGIFTALQFGGVFVSNIICGRLLDRINARYLLVIGAALIGGGFLTIGAAESLPVALAGALTIGFGYGALDVTPNMTVAVLFADKAGAALNLLNVFYGLGAILGPQILNFALAQNSFELAFTLSGIGTLALIIPLAFVSVRVSDTAHPAAGTANGRTNALWIALFPFALTLFLQAGTEVGYSSWVFTEANLVVKTTESTAALAASLFWVGLTAGRMSASILLRRMTNETMLVFTAIVMLIGVGLVVLFPASEAILIIGTIIAGFGSGPLFPTTMAIATLRHPEARGTIAGLLMAVGISGAVAMPYIQGLVGAGVSGGMIVPLLCLAALVMIALFIRGNRAAYA